MTIEMTERLNKDEGRPWMLGALRRSRSGPFSSNLIVIIFFFVSKYTPTRVLHLHIYFWKLTIKMSERLNKDEGAESLLHGGAAAIKKCPALFNLARHCADTTWLLVQCTI